MEMIREKKIDMVKWTFILAVLTPFIQIPIWGLYGKMGAYSYLMVLILIAALIMYFAKQRGIYISAILMLTFNLACLTNFLIGILIGAALIVRANRKFQ